jgi:hypothetical protein
MEDNKELERPEAPPNSFDPLDNLSKDEIEKAFIRADTKLNLDNDKELNLAKSDSRVSGQEWILVSFIGKACSQKSGELGMKVWGAFSDLDSATNYLKDIGKTEENSLFDIYILEMYTWAAIPPDPACIQNQEYHEEKLHNLITTHKQEQFRSKEVFDTRKNKLKNNPDVNQYNRDKEKLNNLTGIIPPTPKKLPTLGGSLKLPELKLDVKELSKDDPGYVKGMEPGCVPMPQGMGAFNNEVDTPSGILDDLTDDVQKNKI